MKLVGSVGLWVASVEERKKEILDRTGGIVGGEGLCCSGKV